jgi:uncharacterized MAPEG superfamily protein
MTIAYGCVLAMIIFPYIFAGLAKYSPTYDNHDPREYLQHLTGWHKRAHYIQLNSFEATPAFGIAVIIAHLIHTHQTSIDTLALIFVISRVCYAIFYLNDKASFRSLFWMIGMACIIGLFFVP